MRTFVRYISSFRGLAQPIEHVERHSGELIGLPQHVSQQLVEARGLLEEAYQHEAAGRTAEEGVARRAVALMLGHLARDLYLHGRVRRAENLRAFLVVAYLRHVFGQLRYALMGAMVPALLVLAALDSYAFVPKHYLWILFWFAVMAASAVSLAVFMQMDRDVVLSRIAGTEPGKVTLDPAFLSNIFAYAILPLIALIASQVPQWGELIGRWVEPLKRVLETN